MSAHSLSYSLAMVSILALVACGGGSGNVGPPSPPPPQPGFTLSLSTASLALVQSGAQNVQVTAVPQNGFSATVTVTASGLPAGVTVSPLSLLLSANGIGTLTFSAASNAASGNAQVSLTGVSGLQHASASLSLNVNQMATPVAM